MYMKIIPIQRIIYRHCCQLVRQNFSAKCEEAINKQIKDELEASYIYLAMAYHFNRCSIASPGLYRFFKKASLEERHHAELFLEYMNKRGGDIQFESIAAPNVSLTSAYSILNDALQMEKDMNEVKSLLKLHELAGEMKDPHLCDFLETNFLTEQVDGIKALADLITQFERCEGDLGAYIFDKYINESSMHGAERK